jgi:release factor glutamine methyltransferase
MTIKEIQKNINLAPFDWELLLSLALNRSKEFIRAYPEYILAPGELRKFNYYAKRRAKGEPMAYIAGKKEFFGLDFIVNRDVLIPRPETEILIEKAIEKLFLLDLRVRGDDKLVLVDIGTGSGNIIISIVKNILAKMRKKVNFYALDISKKALNIAKKNARKHRVEKSIKFVKSDLLGHFLKKKTGFENMIILANLPYISPDIYQKNRENLLFEPKNALVSRHQGLEHYRKLLGQIGEMHKKGYFENIYLLFEISPEQKSGFVKILHDELSGSRVNFSKDLAGRWRLAEICVQKWSF